MSTTKYSKEGIISAEEKILRENPQVFNAGKFADRTGQQWLNILASMNNALSPVFQMQAKHGRIKFGCGQGKASYTTPEGYVFNQQNEMVFLNSKQHKVDRKGLFLREKCRNLILNSNFMNTPEVIQGAYQLNVGTLSSGIPYHSVDFEAGTSGRIYEITPLVNSPGKHTIAMLLFCESGTETVRLSGYDKGNYIVSSDIEIDETPRFYTFTFNTTVTGNQYIALRNGRDEKPRKIFWCNAHINEGDYFKGYVETTDVSIERPQDNFYIPASNLPAPPYVIKVKATLLGAGNSFPRIIQSVGNNGIDYRLTYMKYNTFVGCGVNSQDRNETVFTSKSLKFNEEFCLVYAVGVDSHKVFFNGDKGQEHPKNKTPPLDSANSYLIFFNNSKTDQGNRSSCGYLREVEIFTGELSDELGHILSNPNFE